MTAFFERLRRGFRREDGTASAEFVLAIPVIFTIFLGSFEGGLFMIRSILLEQSVDMTMRELRLGHYPLPDSDLLKDEICSRTVIFTDCQANITLEMTRVSTANWVLPNDEIACVNREEDINPVTALQIGQQNDIMLVRICVIQDAMFPTTGLGSQIVRNDAQGGYAVYAVSAFVTEPS